MKIEKLSLRKVNVGRLHFLDFARGVVMILMAWDHISGFWNRFHHGGEGILGRKPPFINTTWFLARFVSHYCAPTFIFLAGVVLALSTAKRLSRGEKQHEISIRMIKRGVVLLLAEAFIVSPAFDGSPLYFGVIACIGMCFIIFSIYRRLPTSIILVVSIIIILTHQYMNLNWIPSDTPAGWYLRVILHEPNHDWYPFTGLYPIFPWIGVMGLGWSFGSFLTKRTSYEIENLKMPLAITGVASIILFFMVRWLRGFGNILPREGNTLIEWLYVAKYPPSLAFLLWTLGGMCLLLALGQVLQSGRKLMKGISGVVTTIGRNPLFFYLTHLWLYRLRPGWITRPIFYLNLPTTIVFWIFGLVILWKLCIRYENLKKKHPDSLLQYI